MVARLDPNHRRILEHLDELVAFIASRIPPPKADAEDIAQEVVMLAIHGGDRGGQKYDGAGDPRPLLFGIARNVMKLRRYKARLAKDPDAVEAIPASKDPERLVAATDPMSDPRILALRAELAKDALALGVLDLYTQDVDNRVEQAERLGVDENEIKKARERIKDAKARVLRKLDEEKR